MTSYVIARNIDERFPVFGASGAIVFGLLTWLLLAQGSSEGPHPKAGGGPAPAAFVNVDRRSRLAFS